MIYIFFHKAFLQVDEDNMIQMIQGIIYLTVLLLELVVVDIEVDMDIGINVVADVEFKNFLN